MSSPRHIWPIYQLKGGYKAYRRYAEEALPLLVNLFTFITLSDLTDISKTEILHQLKENSFKVLDFEAIANHRGSHFGHVYLPPQPTQKSYKAHLLHIPSVV